MHISEQSMAYAPQGKGVTMLPVSYRSGPTNNECDIGGKVNHPVIDVVKLIEIKSFEGPSHKTDITYHKKPLDPTDTM